MKHSLIYCYDAYCGWCYGFSPVMKKIAAHFGTQLETEVLSGGMLMMPSAIGCIALWQVLILTKMELGINT